VTQMPVVAQTPSAQNNNTGTGAYNEDVTGLASPPPVTAPCGGQNMGQYSVYPSTSCNPEDGEAQLDTEQVAELAPGSNVMFYLAFNNKDCADAPGTCPPDATGVQGLYISDDEIQQAIADNTADVLSLSYGGGEIDWLGFYYDNTGAGPGPDEFAALAAEGIAVFVSTGDTGAYACNDPSTGDWLAVPCVSYPAIDPSVTGVGGVNYPLDSAGNLPPGAAITAWANNTTEGGDGTGDNSVGSGGGVSTVFTTPSWQSSIPLASMRSIPDVSMMADPLTGPYIIQYANFPGVSAGAGASGGTSAAAPEMAAAWAVVLQACKASAACATAGGAHPYRLGNAAPMFYSIYGKPSVSAATFYDVLSGSNGAVQGTIYSNGYNAGPGYDLVTGIGVPFVGHLINAVVSGAKVQ
jgi:subtilase family serine protease